MNSWLFCRNGRFIHHLCVQFEVLNILFSAVLLAWVTVCATECMNALWILSMIKEHNTQTFVFTFLHCPTTRSHQSVNAVNVTSWVFGLSAYRLAFCNEETST